MDSNTRIAFLIVAFVASIAAASHCVGNLWLWAALELLACIVGWFLGAELGKRA